MYRYAWLSRMSSPRQRSSRCPMTTCMTFVSFSIEEKIPRLAVYLRYRYIFSVRCPRFLDWEMPPASPVSVISRLRGCVQYSLSVMLLLRDLPLLDQNYSLLLLLQHMRCLTAGVFSVMHVLMCL